MVLLSALSSPVGLHAIRQVSWLTDRSTFRLPGQRPVAHRRIMRLLKSTPRIQWWDRSISDSLFSPDRGAPDG